jgi:hypothetical protein
MIGMIVMILENYLEKICNNVYYIFSIKDTSFKLITDDVYTFFYCFKGPFDQDALLVVFLNMLDKLKKFKDKINVSQFDRQDLYITCLLLCAKFLFDNFHPLDPPENYILMEKEILEMLDYNLLPNLNDLTFLIRN